MPTPVEKALAKFPGERFATVKAFRTALVETSQKTLDGPTLFPICRILCAAPHYQGRECA